MAQHRSLHWFRKGLRLHDNPSLLAAVKDCQEFRAVFVLDPILVKSGTVGINRWRFLLQSLHDLDDGLKRLGSRYLETKETVGLPHPIPCSTVCRPCCFHATSKTVKQNFLPENGTPPPSFPSCDGLNYFSWHNRLIFTAIQSSCTRSTL